MSPKSNFRKKLLSRLKKKNLFWSYSPTVDVDEISDSVLMDTALKYGDFTDLKLLLEVFGRENVYEFWVHYLLPDNRFSKLNFYLARVVFDVNWEVMSREKNKWSRFEKLTASAQTVLSKVGAKRGLATSAVPVPALRSSQKPDNCP